MWSTSNTTKLLCLAVLVVSIGASDADARLGRRGGNHRQAFTPYQATAPNQAHTSHHVRRVKPGYRARYVIGSSVLLLGGGSGGGDSVCVLYASGWFCTPVD